MNPELPFEFYSYPASKYPITIKAFPKDSTEDTDLVWERYADGPGMLSIPGLKETGQRVRIVIQYGDGTEDRG